MLEYTIPNQYLISIGKECEQKLESIGIKCGDVITYTVITNGLWGQCQSVGSNMFIISIDKLLLEEKYKESLYNTIIHELLHTCDNCYNHGNEWKELTKRVNAELGYYIRQTDSCFEKAVNPIDYAKSRQYKYAILCEECGNSYFRKRKSNFTLHLNEYKCGLCGGDLKLIYKKG